MSETNTLTLPPANSGEGQITARREYRVVQSDIALFDTAKFEHLNRIAVGMSHCGLIPKHLFGNNPQEGAANCLLVVNQAHRWDIDPFALAGETYVVGGKLAYQGKVIKAVIDARSGLKGGLRFRFNTLQGEQFAVVVYGSEEAIPPEAKPLLIALAEQNDRSALGDLEELGIKAVRLDVAQAKTQNDMWKRDPEQKLIYSGALRWARRYRPDIILGIRSDEDLEKESAEAPIPRAVLPSATARLSDREPERQATDHAPEVMPPAKGRAKTKKAAAEEGETRPGGDKEPDPAKPAPEKLPPMAAAEPQAAQEPEPELAAEEANEVSSEAELALKLGQAGYSETELVHMAIALNLCPTTTKTIAEIEEAKRVMILEDWPNALGNLAELRARKGGK